MKESLQQLSPHADAHVYHLNVSAQPSTQRTRSIRSAYGKYNASRALVNSFCLFRTNIVAFRQCFKLNWSGLKTMSGAQSWGQSSSFLSLSLSQGNWQRNAPHTMRARSVVRGGMASSNGLGGPGPLCHRLSIISPYFA